MREKDYQKGSRAAYRNILRTCILELEGQDRSLAFAIAELTDVRAALRRICERLGCNDWPDDLHLADVINNRLDPTIREFVG